MAPPGSSQTLLSPAELSFLHTSLSLHPPVRPDLRSPTQFRPLIAEVDVLPSANGSARICFSDGTEAIVGVKAEIEASTRTWNSSDVRTSQDAAMADEGGEENTGMEQSTISRRPQGRGSRTWLEVSIEIPGFRDDDNLPVFLSSMMTETILASGDLQGKLYINERWHWKLFVDVLLLSTPLSYPLPLLSLTTHLALLHTALPRIISEPNDDPLFDDDWAAAVLLYARTSSSKSATNGERPPVILLVMTVGDNIIFDPSKEELAVAESVLAMSFTSSSTPSAHSAATDVPNGSSGQALKLLAIRTIDPPSRLTPPGVPNSLNPATNAGAPPSTGPGNATAQQQVPLELLAEQEKEKVWSPPRGGMKRALLARIIKMVVEKGGVGEEVLSGLAEVET